MRPKTILACLTTLENAETLMQHAVHLARKHGAHLIGLHTLEEVLVYPGIAMHIPGPAFATFNESQKAEARKIEAVFEEYTEHEEFQSEYRLVQAEATSATERMVDSARAADFVIMAHEDNDADRYEQRHAQVQVIRHSGRPVIVVPLNYQGPVIGANVVIGWTDTRESARAAHDFVALADEGAKVTVLRVGHRPMDTLEDFNGIDVVETLSRHGLNVALEYREPAGDGVCGVLNDVAFEKGADLIVTGALGHSRAYDLVLGSTTYALLRDARLPVLFSK